MTLLIGVDEAGYGPNYGPLAVAATAWRVAEQSTVSRGQGTGKRQDVVLAATRRSAVAERAAPAAPPDLYKLLRRAVVRSPDRCPRRLAIADSKALYKAGLGLRQLERGVLAALACLRIGNAETHSADAGATIGGVFDATRADPARRRHELPCHAADDHPLPIDTPAEDIAKSAARLQQAGEKNGLALAAVRVRLVFPAEFNKLVDHFGTKGAALSHVTLALVRQLIDDHATGEARFSEPGGAERIHIALDKHGGRNRYAALVQHHFPASWIDTLAESRAASRYHWTHDGATVEATFRTRCEELLPTALASMTAKYHRELSMRAFNAFWTDRVPGLRPTCGYPGDARRFKQDIAAAQRDLAIDDRLLWRCR